MEIKHTSIESQNNVQAHGYKFWITITSIIPHTLGMLTANITYCIILLEGVSSERAFDDKHSKGRTQHKAGQRYSNFRWLGYKIWYTCVYTVLQLTFSFRCGKSTLE